MTFPSRYNKKKQSILSKLFGRLKGFVLSSQGFPITLLLTLICILFVLFRMKGVEQDYQYSSIGKKITNEKILNRELKADRARRLSMGNLQKMAKKYNMNEPKQRQIIVIPR